ncbi:MAG TPA: type II toxin-antitoxin system prevent-host-death family antitoxin [Pyrinomonadaceae bacterium]|jgi:prevent-host-death family protein|nr:type II toxin-antitoxin system prevent-host-death family antitoxin [Pyrinomonadaceae bacterium]
MTKTVSLNEAQTQLQGLLALARSGDEVIIEENGEPLARIVPIQKNEPKERVLGLREGQVWTSDDFDEELPDSFWLGEEK